MATLPSVTIAPTPAVVRREGVFRYMDVAADVRGSDLAAAAHAIQAAIKSVPMPLEYRAEVLGDYATRLATQARLLTARRRRRDPDPPAVAGGLRELAARGADLRDAARGDPRWGAGRGGRRRALARHDPRVLHGAGHHRPERDPPRPGVPAARADRRAVGTRADPPRRVGAAGADCWPRSSRRWPRSSRSSSSATARGTRCPADGGRDHRRSRHVDAARALPRAGDLPACRAEPARRGRRPTRSTDASAPRAVDGVGDDVMRRLRWSILVLAVVSGSPRRLCPAGRGAGRRGRSPATRRARSRAPTSSA